MVTSVRPWSRCLGGHIKSKMEMLTLLRGLTKLTTIWTLTAIRTFRLSYTIRAAAMESITLEISTPLSVIRIMWRMVTSTMFGVHHRIPRHGSNRMQVFRMRRLGNSEGRWSKLRSMLMKNMMIRILMKNRCLTLTTSLIKMLSSTMSSLNLPTCRHSRH